MVRSQKIKIDEGLLFEKLKGIYSRVRNRIDKVIRIGDDYNALLQVIFQLLVGDNNLHIRCRIRYSKRDPWKRLIFAIYE